MSERLRLLVIDDDPVARAAIRRAVEQSGLAADIEEAIDEQTAIGMLPVDCVLLDQERAGGRGVEATRAMRVNAPHVPIVLVAGQMSEELLEAAIAAGVTDFIPKNDLSP